MTDQPSTTSHNLQGDTMKLNTADDIAEEMTGAIDDNDIAALGGILNLLIQEGRFKELVTTLESFYLDPVEALTGIGRLPGVETTEPLKEYLKDYEPLWTAKNAPTVRIANT